MKATQNADRTTRRHRFWVIIALIIINANMLTACQKEVTSRLQCEEIFERLVTLELKEMGFDDAELNRRWVSRLRRRYRAELEECVGKEISHDAMSCIKTAKSAEILSHTCLH